VERGTNALQIETACYWTKPKNDWKVTYDNGDKTKPVTTFNKRSNESRIDANILLASTR